MHQNYLFAYFGADVKDTKNAKCLNVRLIKVCRGGGMADATDLKSVDRKVVWVRLPPSAPVKSIT